MKSDTARTIIRMLAIVVSLAGMWISYDLTLKHLEKAKPDQKQEEKGFLDRTCEATPSTSCDTAIESRWGVFPFAAEGEKNPKGIPTAELGLVFFAFILCWMVFVGPVTASRVWAQLILLAGTATGVLSSLFFEYIMWTRLDQWCPLCLVTHVATALLLIFAVLLWPRREPQPAPAPVADNALPADGRTAEPAQAQTSSSLFSPPPEPLVRSSTGTADWPDNRTFATTVVIAVLLVWSLHYRLTTRGAEIQTDLKQQQVEWWQDKMKIFDHYKHAYTSWTIAPEVDISLERVPVKGPADARHTIVIFSDFECSACASFEREFKDKYMPVIQKLGNARVYFKQWPICTDCNPHAARNLHPEACKAAKAAEAARILGGDEGFWKMHDLLYEHQQEWRKNSELFVRYAKDVGLDIDAFVKTMNSKETLDLIKQSIEEGRNLGKDTLNEFSYKWIRVDSTPSVFVNGKRLHNPGHERTWLAVLQDSLRMSAARPGSAAGGTSATSNTRPASPTGQHN